MVSSAARDAVQEPRSLKRNEKNADTLVGEVWTHEGLWTIVASPSVSASLHLAGNVVPSRHELTNTESRIKQYQPAAATPEPVPAPAAAASKSKPARVARPA